MSIDTSYFGDTGETIGQAGGDAVARYLGTIKNWMAKRSGDPKLYVIFDGEGRAVACPVATMTEERYGWALEPFLDGSPAPVYVEPAVAARPRREGSARPAGGEKEPSVRLRLLQANSTLTTATTATTMMAARLMLLMRKPATTTTASTTTTTSLRTRRSTRSCTRR